MMRLLPDGQFPMLCTGRHGSLEGCDGPEPCQPSASHRPRDFTGAQPEVFFAPTQIRKRSVEWGAAEFQRRFASALHRFVAAASDPARGWLRIVEGRGPDAVARAYLDTFEGRVAHDQGHVLTLPAH